MRPTRLLIVDDEDGFRETLRERYELKDFAVTARFDITDNWVFKLEAHRLNGVGTLIDVDNPTGYVQRWSMLLARLSLSF